MRIGVLGDVMPSGVLYKEYLQVSNSLKNHLNSFDVRIATLECAIGEFLDEKIEKYKDNKEVCVWAQSETLHVLKDLNVNIVSLANNHIGDLGRDGLINTMNLLDKLSIKYCGAGLNIEEASKPVIIEQQDKTYVFIAICQENQAFLGSVKYAKNDDWGVLGYDDNIPNYITSLKNNYDYVFVIVHWGVEFKWIPEEIVCDYAKQMIDAGADGIIGGHPHQIQPLLFYKNRPIYYSLGNFLFPEIYVDNNCNVWYPSKKESLELPYFNRFPIGRNFAMRYYWTSLGRKSIIADITVVDNKIRSSYILVKLINNCLVLNGYDYILKCKIACVTFMCRKMNAAQLSLLNYYISICKYLYFYKFKAIFDGRYRFFKFIK